ncbi:peptide ligase PGM1-related protein [Actinophytocola sp.]|uniref:preATP grasp domain-containing protein n=1 Tax=Actinophytocola sp. TaxID=1872138 RepID=UPI002F94C28B
MARLLIGHDVNEDLRLRRSSGTYAQRLLWFAQDGDVLVLPVAPDEAFAEHVTELTGTDMSTLRVVVPPPGKGSIGQLSRDRLRDPGFLEALRAATADKEIDLVSALWPDSRIVELAGVLGLESAVPGSGFLSQSGDALANSKAFFRTLAAGVGVPIADGAVCLTRDVARDTMCRLLGAGHPVILKHEFFSGGWGNDIVSLTVDFQPIGATRMTVLAGLSGVETFLAERWGYLTDDGRHSLVVERYHPDSTAAFAEFSISDDGVALGGTGMLYSLPYVASVLPASGISRAELDAVIAGARLLCEAMRAIGYRGILGPDAIVTPDGEILFTEHNGRATGSTHMYGVIGKKVIGPGFGKDRVIVDRQPTVPWSVASFREAADRLRGSDIAFDPATRRGVMLVQPFNVMTGSIPYVVVDDSVEVAIKTERLLGELFDFAPEIP